MAARYVICPLCSFEFEPQDTLCQHGCPLRTTCGLLRCPSCEFEFPESPRIVSRLGRLLQWRRDSRDSVCDRFMTLRELRTGERAEVVSLAGDSWRRSRRAVLGLAPGSEVMLLQRTPAFVVRAGETELALDEEFAGRRRPVVRPRDPEPPPAP